VSSINFTPTLDVIMYHYVQDRAKSDFPRLKAMQLEDFRRQVASLSGRYEMATIESALDFLEGTYKPSRDLCLLTFDDGLKEHYTDVLPLLAEYRIQGLFFLITRCLEEQVVAPVHMNHLLMASLDWDVYTTEFQKELASEAPETSLSVDASAAAITYPWDTPEVARFKYFFNFVLKAEARDRVVESLFRRHLGEQSRFAKQVYLSWENAREMQSAGMVMGGHSHSHAVLSRFSEAGLASDLESCRHLLDQHLLPQPTWPFCYPYGKKDSFNAGTVEKLKALQFGCSFSTEADSNKPGADRYAIRRIDCNVALRQRNWAA